MSMVESRDAFQRARKYLLEAKVTVVASVASAFFGLAVGVAGVPLHEHHLTWRRKVRPERACAGR
jgi:hypothetical protein